MLQCERQRPTAVAVAEHTRTPDTHARPAFVPGTGLIDQRLVLALRPPPWLALPPLLAISRCFAGSIAANPRLDLPVVVVAMLILLIVDGLATLFRTAGSQC